MSLVLISTLGRAMHTTGAAIPVLARTWTSISRAQALTGHQARHRVRRRVLHQVLHQVLALVRDVIAVGLLEALIVEQAMEVIAGANVAVIAAGQQVVPTAGMMTEAHAGPPAVDLILSFQPLFEAV